MSKEIIKPVPGYEGRYGCQNKETFTIYRKMKDGYHLNGEKETFF